MKKVAIIDYECGNIFSISNALHEINQPFEIIRQASELADFEHSILPGVGSFGPAIVHLKELGFQEELLEFAKVGKSIFGICLGMQLLLSESHENGFHKGLNLIEGKVEKMKPVCQLERVPNIGWSAVNKNAENPLARMIFGENLNSPNYYFVHSYYASPADGKNVIASVEFGGTQITAAIGNANVFGVQFHPEKSGICGLNLLKRIQSEVWKK